MSPSSTPPRILIACLMYLMHSGMLPCLHQAKQNEPISVPRHKVGQHRPLLAQYTRHQLSQPICQHVSVSQSTRHASPGTKPLPSQGGSEVGEDDRLVRRSHACSFHPLDSRVEVQGLLEHQAHLSKRLIDGEIMNSKGRAGQGRLTLINDMLSFGSSSRALLHVILALANQSWRSRNVLPVSNQLS